MEFRQPGFAMHSDQPKHGAHGKFGLVHGGRHRHSAEYVNGALVHVGLHLGDLRSAQAFTLHHGQQRVGSRMGVATGGVELERGFHQRPTAAQLGRQFARLGITGHTCRQTLLTFKDIARAGQPIGRKVSRQQAVRRRLGRVQLLGVGGIAQKLPQPGGLGAGAAEQVDELLFVEVEQLAHRDRCRQGADRGRGVEDAVVGTAQELTDANPRLIAGHRGQQQFTARLAEVLGSGQRGGKYHSGWVQHRAVVQVILLHQM